MFVLDGAGFAQALGCWNLRGLAEAVSPATERIRMGRRDVSLPRISPALAKAKVKRAFP